MTTTQSHVTTTAAPYRRFTWQEALVDYLPVHRRTPRAFKWVERVPTIVILLLMSLMALRLRNSVFIDEALYINAGQDYLNHLLHGSSTPNHGEYFSGAPVVYPVLAAALDAVGGVYLVRLFSLLCMMTAVVAVQDTAQALFNSRRVGLLAGSVFAFTGSVVFISAFATFDALCVLSMATALWFGIKYRGLLSASAVGVALSLAVTVKYTGAVFVPIILVIILLHRGAFHRVAMAIGTMVGGLVPAFLLWGESLIPGIKFTTSARVALSPTTTGRLLVYLGLNIGLLLVVAIWGATRMTRNPRLALIAGAFLMGAVLLPAAQLRLGEAVSFDKHTAYSALFLAPLAGLGLASLSRGLLKLAPVCLFMVVVVLVGLSRSGSLYQGWVDVRPIVKIIDTAPTPGLYVSSSTDALKYYTRKKHPDVRWQTTFSLYAGGERQIRDAVEADAFQMIILRRASTGSAVQDAGQRVLEEAIAENPHYELAHEPFQVQRYSTDAWYVYRLNVPAVAKYQSDSQGTTTTLAPIDEPTPTSIQSSTPEPVLETEAVVAPTATPLPKVAVKPKRTASQLAEIRRMGHVNQRATMKKYGLTHRELHEILGTPVVPFKGER